MCYRHGQQNCHQQVDHRVSGPQDDRPSADITIVTASGAAGLVTEALLESHGHRWES